MAEGQELPDVERLDLAARPVSALSGSEQAGIAIGMLEGDG